MAKPGLQILQVYKIVEAVLAIGMVTGEKSRLWMCCANQDRTRTIGQCYPTNKSPSFSVMLISNGNHLLTLKRLSSRLQLPSSQNIRQRFSGNLALQERSVVRLDEASTASCATNRQLVRRAWSVCALVCGGLTRCHVKNAPAKLVHLRRYPAGCENAANGLGAASGRTQCKTPVGPSEPWTTEITRAAQRLSRAILQARVQQIEVSLAPRRLA